MHENAQCVIIDASVRLFPEGVAIMGFFNSLKNSAAKSRLIAECSTRLESGDFTAIPEIFAHIQSNPIFSSVVEYFAVTEHDVESITMGLMMSGHGARYGSHYVPVSAVLFPDTLAYLMRTERGQLPKAEAYYQVDNHFRRNALIFEPERAFHRGDT